MTVPLQLGNQFPLVLDMAFRLPNVLFGHDQIALQQLPIHTNR